MLYNTILYASECIMMKMMFKGDLWMMSTCVFTSMYVLIYWQVDDWKTYSTDKLDGVKNYSANRFNRFAEVAHLHRVLNMADTVVDKVLPAIENENSESSPPAEVCNLALPHRYVIQPLHTSVNHWCERPYDLVKDLKILLITVTVDSATRLSCTRVKLSLTATALWSRGLDLTHSSYYKSCLWFY